jgi:hypothetical protein
MSVSITNVELKFLNVVVDIPIDVSVMLFDEDEVTVYYGSNRLVATLNVDYTVVLQPDDGYVFQIVPAAPLISKIIANDLGNVLFIRRESDFISDFQQTDGFHKNKIEREFDKKELKLQELKDRITTLEGYIIPPNEVTIPESVLEGSTADFDFVARKFFLNGDMVSVDEALDFIRAGTKTYVNPLTRIVETLGVNIPTWDHRGLLLEPIRYNYIKHSRNLAIQYTLNAVITGFIDGENLEIRNGVTVMGTAIYVLSASKEGNLATREFSGTVQAGWTVRGLTSLINTSISAIISAGWQRNNVIVSNMDQIGHDGEENACCLVTFTANGGTLIQSVTNAEQRMASALSIKRVSGVGAITLRANPIDTPVVLKFDDNGFSRVNCGWTEIENATLEIWGETLGDSVIIDMVMVEPGAYSTSPVHTTSGPALNRAIERATFPGLVSDIVPDISRATFRWQFLGPTQLFAAPTFGQIDDDVLLPVGDGTFYVANRITWNAQTDKELPTDVDGQSGFTVFYYDGAGPADDTGEGVDPHDDPRTIGINDVKVQKNITNIQVSTWDFSTNTYAAAMNGSLERNAVLEATDAPIAAQLKKLRYLSMHDIVSSPANITDQWLQRLTIWPYSRFGSLQVASIPDKRTLTNILEVSSAGNVPPPSDSTQRKIFLNDMDWHVVEDVLSDAGAVIGPASATDNAVARFNGPTGEIIQNSTLLLPDTGELLLPAVAAPAVSPAASVALFAVDRVGRPLPGFRSNAGGLSRLQPFLGSRRVARTNPSGGGGVTLTHDGAGTVVATGTATGRSPATTNLLTSLRRIAYVSAAGAGSSCGLLPHNAVMYWRGNAAGLGGFHLVMRAAVSDAAAVADARWAMGLFATGAVIGNVNPSTLLDFIALACDNGAANLSLMHNDGAGVATSIALGASFPANTLSADLYELELYAAPNAAAINYRVTNAISGAVASGVVSTDLITSTTFVAPQFWRNNGATALAVGIDIITYYNETEY